MATVPWDRRDCVRSSRPVGPPISGTSTSSARVFYLYYCAFEGTARLLVTLEEEYGQRIDLETAVENEGLPDHGDFPRLPELVTHLHGVARAKAREIDFDFDALLKSVRSRHLHVGATLSV